MATKTPRTYDEITRNTVIEPDSSRRPSREQVASAYGGSHTRAADEMRLYADVEGTLVSHPEGARIGVEIDGTTVTLRGRVHSIGAVNELENLVRGVPGVDEVRNKLVVGS